MSRSRREEKVTGSECVPRQKQFAQKVHEMGVVGCKTNEKGQGRLKTQMQKDCCCKDDEYGFVYCQPSQMCNTVQVQFSLSFSDFTAPCSTIFHNLIWCLMLFARLTI